MIKIKMVKPAITIYGAFNAGQVVDIPDDMARAWVKTGLAEPELTEKGSSAYGKRKLSTPGSFFCQACLEDKSVASASPDPRYCQACYDFLKEEAEMLPGNKYLGWVPKDSQTITRPPPSPCSPLPGHQKPIQVSQDMVLNMSTLNDKKTEVDLIKVSVGKVTREKRGRKPKPLPRELIKKWAVDGMGSKAIASRLKRELGIKVSYKTVQRALNASYNAKLRLSGEKATSKA